MADSPSTAAPGQQQATGGGVSGLHSEPVPVTLLVAPSTGAGFNRIRFGLVPRACWSVEDVRFAFDSSFISADTSTGGDPQDIRQEFADLKRLLAEHPGAPLSVFGHADPVGDDDYNKALSGRRATAIYALLLFNADPATAVGLWSQLASEEHWGKAQGSTMQQLTGAPAGTPAQQLIAQYLKVLCADAPTLAKTDFLARGTGKDGKGDLQGCSEFNPRLLFSQEKQARYDSAKQAGDTAALNDRNSDNTPNRRVNVLLFRKGSVVDPVKWPCPTVKEGIAGCKARFWADGETRRNTHLPGTDRRFADTEDTFACRFYQRLSTGSPCENVLQAFSIRLYDADGKFMAGAPYRLELPGGQPRIGTADAQGYVNGQAANLPLTCPLYWGKPPDRPYAEPGGEPDSERGVEPDYTFTLDVCIQPRNDQPDEVDVRLRNLACAYSDEQQSNVKTFQLRYGKSRGLRQDGVLDDQTHVALREIHDGCGDNLEQETA